MSTKFWIAGLVFYVLPVIICGVNNIGALIEDINDDLRRRKKPGYYPKVQVVDVFSALFYTFCPGVNFISTVLWHFWMFLDNAIEWFMDVLDRPIVPEKDKE